MINPVFYLTLSIDEENQGFVFPSELPEDYYASGIWVVAVSNNEQRGIPREFEFDAIKNNEVVKYKLTRVNAYLFQVNDEKYGKFFFQLERLSKITGTRPRYTGKSTLIDGNSSLYIVIPLNERKLEAVCREGFFFTGRSS